MPYKEPHSDKHSYSHFFVVAPFFLSSFFWNVALGMTYILIPLYARALGMSGVQIGTLVALPVALQIAFTLLGGALTDRTGGKSMAMIACILTCGSAIAFMFSAGFAAMFAAQVIMIVARSIFWPATWSLASELPGNPATQFGRLNAATNAGQIAGTAAAGIIIMHTSFRFGFGMMAATGVAALLFNQIYQPPALAKSAATNSVFATYRNLLGKRTMRYGMLCGYISSLPISLSFSFYPILLVEQGFNADITGSLMSLRALGAIAAGLIAGYLIPNTRSIITPFISASVVALMVALGAATAHPVMIGLYLFVLGASASTMILFVQMLVGQVSNLQVRGSAMALINAGWGISLLTTPLMMGVFKDLFGIQAAFYIIGIFTLVCSLSLIPVQRWAFAEQQILPRPASNTNSL
jgi:MFS family permease